ncbi:MAG TPA: MIP family channel protein [Campylobacterales bacterium]|nr:MIP family channel protein [Campylobacterales bacterium]
MSSLKARLTAEFIGTFILVFSGTGAVIVEMLTGAMGHVGIALTFGLVVTALIYAFGHISGAHFNPAVSIAFVVMGEFEKKELLPYILAQILGAILASLTLYLLFIVEIKSMADVAYLGATLPRGSVWQSFLFEFILTFILMLIIASSAVHAKAVKSFAGLAIGFTVGLEAMFAGPICGASMNPARSIAPALVSGHLEHLWLYIVATILGAVASVYVYNIMKEKV